MAIQAGALAVHRAWISLSGRAHRLGNLGDLLFKSAVGLVATCARAGVYGVWHLGLMAVAQTAYVVGLCGSVSERAHLVDLDPPLAPSSMAAGGGGDATGDHRRRPCTYHGRPQF